MSVKVIDLVRNIQQTNEKGRVSKNAPSVIEGLTVHEFDPSHTGYRIVPPEALLSLQVPVIDFDPQNQSIKDFQRFLKVPHARRIGRALTDGKEMPPVLVSIDENGNPLITDGQHRTIGAIIARKPIPVVVEHRTREKAQQLFADQKKGVLPDNDTLILSGDGPYNEYIQDAVTDPNHVWYPIAGPGKVGGAGSFSKMTPFSMKFMLTAYVGNQAGTKGGVDAAEDRTILSRWDREMADELGHLVLAFGTKQTRPEAFTSVALRAIAITATLVIGRTGRHAKDIERWKRHMPLFNFTAWGHLKGTDLTDMLLNHWNKKLKTENKVARPGR